MNYWLTVVLFTVSCHALHGMELSRSLDSSKPMMFWKKKPVQKQLVIEEVIPKQQKQEPLSKEEYEFYLNQIEMMHAEVRIKIFYIKEILQGINKKLEEYAAQS